MGHFSVFLMVADGVTLITWWTSSLGFNPHCTVTSFRRRRAATRPVTHSHTRTISLRLHLRACLSHFHLLPTRDISILSRFLFFLSTLLSICGWAWRCHMAPHGAGVGRRAGHRYLPVLPPERRCCAFHHSAGTVRGRWAWALVCHSCFTALFSRTFWSDHNTFDDHWTRHFISPLLQRLSIFIPT